MIVVGLLVQESELDGGSGQAHSRAHHTLQAALGAATSILDDPDGTPGMLAKRETQRPSEDFAAAGHVAPSREHHPGYAIAWWNRYFRDLTKYEPRRIRSRAASIALSNAFWEECFT